jgi:hypothetical protein
MVDVLLVIDHEARGVEETIRCSRRFRQTARRASGARLRVPVARRRIWEMAVFVLCAAEDHHLRSLPLSVLTRGGGETTEYLGMDPGGYCHRLQSADPAAHEPLGLASAEPRHVHTAHRMGSLGGYEAQAVVAGINRVGGGKCPPSSLNRSSTPAERLLPGTNFVFLPFPLRPSRVDGFPRQFAAHVWVNLLPAFGLGAFLPTAPAKRNRCGIFPGRHSASIVQAL